MSRSGKVAALSALVVLLAACGGAGNPRTAAPPAPSSASATRSTPPGASRAKLPTFNHHGSRTVAGSSLHLEADNFYFEPSVIRGVPGQRIRVTIENSSAIKHNFTVKSEHVDVDLDPHSTETATVTIPASGFLSFYCEYHRATGMAGVLQAT